MFVPVAFIYGFIGFNWDERPVPLSQNTVAYNFTFKHIIAHINFCPLNDTGKNVKLGSDF